MMPNIPIPHRQVVVSSTFCTMSPLTHVLMMKGVAGTKVKNSLFLRVDISAMMTSTDPFSNEPHLLNANPFQTHPIG